MKKVQFDKDLLNGLYGLSCIENYVLYILRREGFSYQHLYFQSGLSFGEIVEEFIHRNARFAYFYRIKRLQNVAEENGLIQMISDSRADFSAMHNHDFACVMVEPEYVKKKYHVDLWRDDHFILLSEIDKSRFHYLNDTPRDAGVISSEELKRICSGGMVAIDIGRDVTEELKREFLYQMIPSIRIDDVTAEYDIGDFGIARDILGVCRILRKRLYEFSSQYLDSGFLIPYLNLLDKQYMSVEYMRLRKKTDRKKLNDIMLEVAVEDRKHMTNLLKMLCEI